MLQVFYHYYSHFQFSVSICIASQIERIEKTVSITSKTVELEEKGVRLKLTVVDTPGFGDSVNTNEWFVKKLKLFRKILRINFSPKFKLEFNC